MAAHAPALAPFTNVVVGAGTAGCLLANRLSADPSRRVLLIEAGRTDQRYMWHQVPVGYLFCIGNPRTDWMMKMEPCDGLNGRALNLPRGKSLGGCSSINGMIYMRGQKADYDHWATVTNDERWKWVNVLPMFLKHENYYGAEGPLHSKKGEWYVSKQRLAWEVLEGYADAAVEFGIPRISDFNTGDSSGVAYFDVNQRDGWRWSASSAFLNPAKGRSNLTILTDAHVSKLVVNPRTLTAEGVEFFLKGACAPVQAMLDLSDARSELVLSAGAINSPHILHLSGIGPSAPLKSVGIDVIHELSGVGENLQDHLQIRTEWYVKDCTTLNRLVRNPIALAKMSLEYAMFRTGPLSMSPSQLGIFTKSDPSQSVSNVEFHVQPLSLDKFGEPLHSFNAITSSVANLYPTSRGYVRPRSADFREHPIIQMNYLQTEKDKKIAADSITLARSICRQPAFSKFLVDERKPGKEVTSAADLAKAAGDVGTTIFHPVGTCAMGKVNDPSAVVDSTLRVRGMSRLRVADASIMPFITGGNTNSPTLMIAEMAAAMMMEKTSSCS